MVKIPSIKQVLRREPGSAHEMLWVLARRLLWIAFLALVGPRAGWAQRTPVPPLPAVPVSPITRPAIEVADSLYRAMDVHGAAAILVDHLETVPDDAQALWRATRALIESGILTEDRDIKLELLRSANRYADRLLALLPGDTLALQWAAAAKGRLGIDDYNPLHTVDLGRSVWELTDTLLRLEPDDPLGNAIRGKFIQEVLKLSWFERQLARLLVGWDVVSAASWEDSEAYLERAVREEPGIVVFHLDLGDTYRLQGKNEDAFRTYRAGLDLPDLHPVDAYYKRQISRRVQAMEGGGI